MTNKQAVQIFCELMKGRYSEDHLAQSTCIFHPTDDWGSQKKTYPIELLVKEEMMWIWTGNAFDIHGYCLRDEARAFQYEDHARVGIEFAPCDRHRHHFELNCGVPGEGTGMVCRLHENDGGDDQVGKKKYLS